MAVYVAPFLQLTTDTDIMASGDALTTVTSFPNVPEHGVIHTVQIIDRDSENVNMDIVFFRVDTSDGTGPAGTAINAAFAPSNAELSTLVGSVLVDTWKAFSTNSMGIETNIGLPYWAPNGRLYFQLVTRGTPTYTATTDLLASVSIVY